MNCFDFMIDLPIIYFTVSMLRLAKKTEKKTARRLVMFWNGLRTSAMSLDSNMLSTTARDISIRP